MCAVTARRGNIAMIKFLIDNGANVNAATGEFPKSVLEHAMIRGDLPTIKLLIESGASIAEQRSTGYDVLMAAVIHAKAYSDENLIALIQYLIDRGVPADRVTIHNESAVHYASWLGRFEIVRCLLAVGATEGTLKWTELMRALAIGSHEDVERFIKQGVDHAARDSSNRTPWLLCAQTGDISNAERLLASGANREDCDHCNRNAMVYAIMNDRVEMLSWLIEQGFDIEARDRFSASPLRTAAEEGAWKCVQRLVDAGADIAEVDKFNRPPIAETDSPEVLRILLAAGADLCDINDDMRAMITGVCHEGFLDVSREDYFAGKYRRFGNANPELMNVEFWNAMARSGVTAYRARKEFDDTESFKDPAVWCFHRFGKSITELPDGRYIEIGGEHEDYYDPDFQIYNDVVVHYGNGKFQLYGYPEGVFPPTDFHSATLVGDDIYIIGGLGYQGERRFLETPVYKLHCDSLAIVKVETSGENPGWISEHKAKLDCNSIVIWGGKLSSMGPKTEEYEDNSHRYALDLSSMRWRRLSDLS